MTILITGANRQLGNELKIIFGEGTSELGVLPLFYAQSKVVPVDIPVRRGSSANFLIPVRFPVFFALDTKNLMDNIGASLRDLKVPLDNFLEKYLEMESMQ